jgi:glutamate 5-kinase
LLNAVRARKSLFAPGVAAVEGEWEAQDAVALVDDAGGAELGRALVNYSAAECRKLLGLHSADRADALGYHGAEAIADRDNVVLFAFDGADEHSDAHAPPRSP